MLFLLLPLLSLAKLTQPISTAYKLAIAWGGLRGALTLVLALAVTENRALTPEVQRFVAVLATGMVLFTLLVNGTTLQIRHPPSAVSIACRRSTRRCATGFWRSPTRRSPRPFARPGASMKFRPRP